MLHETQGKHAESEALYEQTQANREKLLGPEHPDVATTLNDLAGLLERQVRATRCSYSRTTSRWLLKVFLLGSTSHFDTRSITYTAFCRYVLLRVLVERQPILPP